jgi:hypothetical protein
MGKTYNSWNSINELNIFNNPKKGKQVFTSPTGQRQRMSYKIQDSSNFMIKLFRFPEVIDGSGNISTQGFESLVSFFNNQPEMVNAFGKFDNYFFGSKFLLYTVLKDEEDKDKVQFTIVERSDYPRLNSKYNMVNATTLISLLDEEDPKDAEIIVGVKDNRNKAQDKDIDDPEKMEDKGSTDLATGTQETEEDMGNKFRYTMRTNGKLYLMEIAAGGAIDAKVMGEEHPNGAISWENSKVWWYTESDSAENLSIYSKWIDADIPLYTDGEITDPTDKEFLTKIFTDKEFRKKIIKEYHDEFGESEIDSKSIKRMLFFKDGSPIFPEEIKPVEANTPSSKPSSTPSSPINQSEDEYEYQYTPKAYTKYF